MRAWSARFTDHFDGNVCLQQTNTGAGSAFIWSFRKSNLYAVVGIHPLGGRNIELRQRDLACRMLVEDPKRLAGQRIVLRGEAMAIAEDKNGKRRRFLARERCAAIGCGPAIVAPAFFISQVFYFVGESLDVGGKLNVAAIIAVDHNGRRRRRTVRTVIISGERRIEWIA